ncbi:MAG: nucleotidyltransferase family protein [Candidatus Sulfotelmatobacter sp.]|jgi:hypothetical protein
MNRRLAETIIRYLSFSAENGESGDSLGGFNDRQWEDTFRWLDNANVALYLLQKLRDTHDDGKLPPAVLSRLEQNYSDNRLRVDEMASAFAEVNERFRRFAVNYAVVKGFSLVPEFCPDAYLRQQSDFDYLVDEQSVPMAQQALADLGFSLMKHRPTAGEWIFSKRPISHSFDSGEQYEGKGSYVIELHLAIWSPHAHGIDIAGTQFSSSCTVDREWRGVHFRALPEEDAFLLQVLHTFQHLLYGDIRMVWLYEIAYCLHRRPNDTSFWQGVERRTEADALLTHVVAIVTGLAAGFFQAPLPAIAQAWKANLRPSVKVWMEHYGWRVAFEKMPTYELAVFPASKLVLFLHRQFLPDVKRRRDFTRRRLLPWTRPASIVRSSDEPSSRGLKLGGLLPEVSSQFMFHRLLYHAGSGLRYLCEIPRWLWLNRSKAVREVPEISTRSMTKR